MKRLILTFILIFARHFAEAQTNPKISHVFLDLPLDKSREEIQKAIRSDQRFKSSDRDTIDWLNEFTYIGLSSDNGVVNSRPDSIEIELTYRISSDKRVQQKSSVLGNVTILKLRYFYACHDSVEKEYQKIINLLRPISMDTAYTSIDTIFSDSPLRRQFKATGMTFRNVKPKFNVQVLSARLAKSYFGLFLEYEKDEN